MSLTRSVGYRHDLQVSLYHAHTPMLKRRVSAVPRRCLPRARIPSRRTPMRRWNSIKPTFAHKAPIPHQTRPTTEEELLHSAPVFQRLADVPESHDARHGFRWRNDARNAVCHGGSHIFFYSFRFGELTQSMNPHAEKLGPGSIARSAAEPATA